MRTFTLGAEAQLEIDVRAPQRVLLGGGAVAVSFLVQARWQGVPVNFWPNEPHANRFVEHFSFTTQLVVNVADVDGNIIGTKAGAGFRAAFWRTVARRLAKVRIAQLAGITVGEVTEAMIDAAPLAVRRLARANFTEPINMRLLGDSASDELTAEPTQAASRLRPGTTATIDCDFDSYTTGSPGETETAIISKVRMNTSDANRNRTQLRFPLGSLPGALTVTDVDLQFNVITASNVATLDVHPYNGTADDDPDLDTAGVKDSRTIGGTAYITAQNVLQSTGSKSVDLGATADGHLQGNVGSPNLFSLGLRATGDNAGSSSTAADIEAIENTGTDPATLTVVYTDPLATGAMTAARGTATFSGVGVEQPDGVLVSARVKTAFSGGGVQASNYGPLRSTRGKTTFSGNGVQVTAYAPQHRVWATIYDIDGTTIKGQLMRVLRGSTLREIDALGYFQLVADALDPYADELIEGREVDIYYEGHGVRMRGIIETVVDGVNERGELTTTVSGMSLGAELLYQNTYMGITIDNLAQASALDALLANADAAWTSLVTGSGYLNISARFNNQNLWQAVRHVGAMSRAYVRETWTKRQLELKNTHTTSGIMATNLDAASGVLGTASKIAPIVGQLTITRDATELYNRVVPYGRGSPRGTFDLRRSSRSSPYAIQEFVQATPSITATVHADFATDTIDPEDYSLEIEVGGNNRAVIAYFVTKGDLSPIIPYYSTSPLPERVQKNVKLNSRSFSGHQSITEGVNLARAEVYTFSGADQGRNTLHFRLPSTTASVPVHVILIALQDVTNAVDFAIARDSDIASSSSGTTSSETLSTAVGDFCIDILVDNSTGTLTPGGSQTLLSDQDDATATFRMDLSTKLADTTSEIMSWTKGTAGWFLHVSLAIEPQLVFYIEDSASVSAHRRRVKILADLDFAQMGELSAVALADTLYDYASDFLGEHKDEALFYAFEVAGLPTTEGDLLLPGDTIRLAYRGRVVENGVARLWKTVDAQLIVVGIRELWEREGPRHWQLMLSTLRRQPPRMDSRLGQLFLAVDRQGSAGVLG